MIQPLLHELLYRIDKLRQVLQPENLHPQINERYLQDTQHQLQGLRTKLLQVLQSNAWVLPGTRANFYSDYQRLNETLLKIEYYRVQVIRQYGPPELYFNSLMRRMWKEMGISGSAPLVTTISTSSNYFWAMASFNLIGAPPGEEAHLLNLPDLIHEVGHILHNYFNSPYPALTGSIAHTIQNQFQQEHWSVEDEERPASLKEKLINWEKSWLNAWQVEFTCDILATYFTGPAYAWTNLKLSVAERPENIYETEAESHPSHEARMRAINHMLRLMGHGEVAGQVAQEWNEILSLPGYQEPPYYAMAFPDNLLEELVQNIFEGCQLQGWFSFDEQVTRFGEPVSRLINQAWQKLKRDQSGYARYEQTTIRSLYQSLQLA